MPNKKFVFVKLNGQNWECRVDRTCTYTRALKPVVDLVKHIRWHLTDKHQGRKMLKMNYSFYIEQGGQKVFLTDYEVSKWQASGSPIDIWKHVEDMRRARTLCPQEEKDLEQIVHNINTAPTEYFLLKNMWLLHKYIGSLSPHLIEAKVSVLRRLHEFNSTSEELCFNDFCKYAIECQMKFQSDNMDLNILTLLHEFWKTSLFDLDSYHHHFSTIIEGLFSKENREVKIGLSRLFSNINETIDGSGDPEKREWVSNNMQRREMIDEN